MVNPIQPQQYGRVWNLTPNNLKTHFTSTAPRWLFAKIVGFLPFADQYKTILTSKGWKALLDGTSEENQQQSNDLAHNQVQKKPIIWTVQTIRSRAQSQENRFILDDLALKCISKIDGKLSESEKRDNPLIQEITKKKSIVEIRLSTSRSLSRADSLFGFGLTNVLQVKIVNISKKKIKYPNLWFDSVPSLILPENIELKCVCIDDCADVKFPANLSIVERLSIRRCKNLTSHSSKLNKVGTLFDTLTTQLVEIWQCENINRVANNLYLKNTKNRKYVHTIAKRVNLSSCSNLVEVAKNLSIRKEPITKHEPLNIFGEEPINNEDGIKISNCKKVQRIADKTFIENLQKKKLPPSSITVAINSLMEPILLNDFLGCQDVGSKSHKD